MQMGRGRMLIRVLGRFFFHLQGFVQAGRKQSLEDVEIELRGCFYKVDPLQLD